MERLRVLFIVAGLAVMLVLHVAVVIWALFRSSPSRRVAEHAEGEGGGGGAAAGLSAEEVGELPCHEFKHQEGAAGECAVCLEALRAGDRRCTALPRCGHVFHAECVSSWLRKSRRCPVCRAEVVVEQREDAAAVEIVVTEDQ